MNDSQYRDFWKSCALAFPRIAEFFIFADFTTKRELDEAEHAQRHAIWKRTLLPLNIDDCDRALTDMVDGKITGPGFDPSDFPGKIRSRASEIANHRAREAANAKQRAAVSGERWSLRGDMEASRAFMFVTERIGDMRGRPRQEIRDAIADALDECWPDRNGHPVFPDDWEPASAADRSLLARANH
jgi:hypothetical protein